MAKTLFISLTFSIILSSIGAFGQTDIKAKNSMETRAELADHCTQSTIKIKKLYTKALTLIKSINDKDAKFYKKSLEVSHKAWLSYSDSHCNIIAYQSREAATGGDSFYYDCKNTLNEIRIKELEELLVNLQLEFTDELNDANQ